MDWEISGWEAQCGAGGPRQASTMGGRQGPSKQGAYLIFVIFSPRRQFLVQFFSTQS